MAPSVAPAASAAPAPRLTALRPTRSSQTLLFVGLLLVYTAFWSGPSGYQDISCYATDAETLWLHGQWDMPLPPVAPGAMPLEDGHRYDRFSIGLPVVSGPFVWAGELAQLASGGAIGRRWIMAMLPPLAMAGACVLLLRIGVRCGIGERFSLLAAVILGLSASSLYYSRLFYVEPVVGLSALGGIWLFLDAWRAEAPEPGGPPPAGAVDQVKLLGAGAAVAAATACHYAEAPLTAVIGVAMAGMIAARTRGGERLRALAALALVPALVALAILGMNAHRYGGALTTGYAGFSDGRVDGNDAASRRQNSSALFHIALGMPWVVPALAAMALRLRRPWDAAAWCAGCALAAVVAQECLWWNFPSLWRFALRYQVVVTMVAAIGLPWLVAALHRRWGGRGLGYGCAVALMCAAWLFIANADFCRPFNTLADDALYPHQVTIGTWYVSRAAYHDNGDYTWAIPGGQRFITDPRAPFGALAKTVMAALIAGGALVLAMAWRRSPPPAETAAHGPAPAAAAGAAGA